MGHLVNHIPNALSCYGPPRSPQKFSKFRAMSHHCRVLNHPNFVLWTTTNKSNMLIFLKNTPNIQRRVCRKISCYEPPCLFYTCYGPPLSSYGPPRACYEPPVFVLRATILSQISCHEPPFYVLWTTIVSKTHCNYLKKFPYIVIDSLRKKYPDHKIRVLSRRRIFG